MSSSSDNIKKCDALSYTIYTNIFMFTDWIKSTAKSGQSPWKVALFYSSNHSTHPSEYFCGGVLLSQTFVITAAHCLNPKQKDRTKDADIMLRFGAHDLNVKKDPNVITESLLKSYIHEDWNSDSNIYDADIALLEIKNPITYTNFIKPIYLWNGDNSLDEAEGTVVGWGMIGSSNFISQKPVVLTIEVVKNEKCLFDHRDLFTISSNRTFCGGAKDASSILCVGSSGSGLYVENQKKFYLRGLVSAIWDRCDATTYIVYTNIFMFTDWIKSTEQMARTVPVNRSKKLWPWIVALFNRKSAGYFCGGVIISKTFVVTAAQCLYPKRECRKDDADIILKYGVYDLKNTNDQSAKTVFLKKSYIHEDWNPNSLLYDADIALLEIENPITYTHLIKPINLWTGDSLYVTNATLVGWGKTSNNEYSDVPLKMVVPIVDNEKCWLDHNELLKLS